jgi:hypothetical protein
MRVSGIFAILGLGFGLASAQSRWVHPGPDGKLIYAQSPLGDRIVDFSHAGYRGGGVAIPVVTARKTVMPSGGDDTSAIQAAIDSVAKLPLVDGDRGAVELGAGTFHCAKTLSITASGVVLRGAGAGAAGTTLELTGDPHVGLEVKGKLDQRTLGAGTTLTDAYVPSGTTVIHVADASQLHPGDALLLAKPVTPAWLHFMGMDSLERAGKEEKWVGVQELFVRRRVAVVIGNEVRFEVPLTDSIDAKFFPGVHPAVTRVEVTGQIEETGIEHLRIVAPARSVALGKDPEFDGIKVTDAVDSWIRDVNLEDTTNSVGIDSGTERVTVVQVDVQQKIPVSTPAKPFDFSCNGSQILFDRCSGKGDEVFYMATQARQQGPVVILHSKFAGNGHIQPHQRWSTGLLVDGCEVPGGGIDLQNRGTMGSGHGWPIGWSVLWNNSAGSFVVQQPPGAANWSIGDRGSHEKKPMPTTGGAKGADLPQGIVESPGKPVAPASLYLAQLRDRMGDAALKAIGYSDATP